MKAKEGVIDQLNNLLTIELTAVNQYVAHAEMCRNWGYERLCQKLRDIGMQEMKDAQRLVRHILYLEGLPNMQRLGTVRIGESVLEDLELDLEAERNAVETLTGAISHCAQAKDYTTRNILEEMVRDEEEHVDWLETQLETIRQIGIENYLMEQIS